MAICTPLHQPKWLFAEKRLSPIEPEFIIFPVPPYPDTFTAQKEVPLLARFCGSICAGDDSSFAHLLLGKHLLLTGWNSGPLDDICANSWQI